MRYAFFHMPDMLILVLILLILRRWTDLPLWVYGCIGGLWVAKEVFIFPLRWKFYEPARPGETRSLIGTEGIAEERLAPSGHVRVEGELWQAEVVGKKAPVEKGETVLVEGINGFTLLVQPTPAKPPANPKKPPKPPRPAIGSPPPKPPEQPKRTMGDDNRGLVRWE